MDPARFTRVDATTWRLEPHGAMQVPAVIYADESLLRAMDDKVGEQLANVASLPGIVDAAYALPDAHWGYGFPIGGVAAFDAAAAGVISAGGVGFDISCGVRTMLTDLSSREIEPLKESLADALLATVPAGLGGKGEIRLNETELDAMLLGGAVWAVARGWGEPEDLIRIEERGRMAGAEPAAVSAAAKRRQRAEMGTLGSGNHYLEVQTVAEILDPATAEGFGLERGRIVVTIHCGSRGLGHQIGTDYLREMALAAGPAGIALPDRELACARIASELGQRYLGAMRAGINCALANREIIGQLARQVFTRLFGSGGRLRLLFDVSHNTCKPERHRCADGVERELHVHRKGATRALGPGDPSLPEALRPWGQPVLIGGSMGTDSWVLVGCGQERAFASAVHGAGRSLSRHQALRQWSGRQIVDELASRGILVRSHSLRGVAEEAPGAYKDVDAVVAAAEAAGLARRVARLRPVICIKG